jgi:hypothetical protein
MTVLNLTETHALDANTFYRWRDELEANLHARRQLRAQRQASARKGASTKRGSA